MALTCLATSCQQRATSVADQPVRIRWARDPESLDPFQQPNQAALEGLNLISQSLLAIDLEKCRTEPQLAQALPTRRSRGDSLTLISFQIRPQARWDNGRPVLASDVAFTMRLMLCPRVPAESTRLAVDFVKDVEPDPADPRRITFVCRGSDPSFETALGDFLILPEAYLDPKGSLRVFSLAQLRRPAAPARAVLEQVGQRYEAAQLGHHPEHLPGSGPYRLSTWESGRQLVFTRKTQWWADALPERPLVLTATPHQLRYEVLPEDASATLALRRGDVDIYPNMPARTFDRLQHTPGASAQLRFYTALSYDVLVAGFNCSRPALADSATRHALSLLFNTPALLQATQLGLGRRTTGMFSPNLGAGYNDSLPLLPYSLAAAQQRLRQAGWQRTATGWQRAGVPLHLALRYRAADPTYEIVALQFAQAARSIGVDVQLRATEASSLTTAFQQGDFDVYVQLQKGNPFRFDLTPIFSGQGIGAGNITRFATPAADRLLKALALAATPATQTRLLRKVQVMLRDQLPIVPLFTVPNRVVADRQLTNLHISTLKPGYQATAIERGGAAQGLAAK
ncbi:ABC transporter substrate-binding protein (plasmid) [Hymenobacter sp. BRD128]|uniref:ABC transporter substrate-binding protein n=1 Tax=Hymenobacter sp. BRD128 TaxID=2675878 RepID=UPI001566BFA5|nr:ABC transporter substrate-binding protein [Hymenobacter sp. BRD128]QKG59115.1 ABC transporter substrate-binding protein [Hymenobacter sp. BRD128]